MFKAIVKTVIILLLIFNIHYIFPSLISADDDATGSTTASVSVPPRASDLQLSTSLVRDNPIFNQNNEIEVQITYGSYLPFAAPMTIVGRWSQGTIEGQSYPGVDILDYINGSATDAYGNTPPVVDTVNRTITWTISSFPEQLSDKTLNFRLKTNSSYTASLELNFTIGAYLTDSETTIYATDISRKYKYSSSGPGPTLTPTSAPTPAPQYFSIKTVSIQTISDKSVTIYLATNQQSKYKAGYGTSPNLLNKSVIDDSLSLDHKITLPNLTPDTKYYFKITAVNKDNQISTSDIFSVKTATASELPIIALNTLTVTSANKVLVAPVSLTSDSQAMQEQKTLVIPQSTIYDLRFSFKEPKPLKSIKVALRKRNMVLGINTSIFAKLFNFNNQSLADDENSLRIMPTAYAGDVNVKEIGLTEIQSGIFYGRLISNLPVGEYELFAVTSDNNGNIFETKLSNVKVISRFMTLDKESKEPIENARIYLSFYNFSSKKYEPLLPTLISIENPSFTDALGESSIVLPQGRYRALVSDLGYKDKTVDFIIGIGKNDGFPTVHLEKESFNLMSTAIYYGRGIRDVYIYYTMQYFTSLSRSLRFFNLINTISLGLFIIVTFLSFRFRTHIPLRSLFSYLIYHLRKSYGQNMSSFYLEGIVTDEKTKIPISKAQIYLIDKNTHQTIKQTTTNTNGHFFFNLNNHKNYEILVIKKGYEITPFIEAAKETYANKTIKIMLKKSESQNGLFGMILTKSIEVPIGYLFEYLLISSLIFEVTSIPYFGLGRTIPFIAISGFNLLLWILHLKQKNQNKKVI